MEQEKIYVLVPVYNVEAYLERCINSILNQTYTNWELVLVDDGSPDNSGLICDRYAAEHDNITVIHQENGGVSVARNTAVAYALEHGDHHRDWINFVDSDDFVHPKYLEYLHRAAKEAGTEISCCHSVRTSSTDIHPDNGLPFTYNCLTPETYWCRKNTIATSPWGKLYRLGCFQSILYPVGKIYEDDFTTFKLLFNTTQVAVICDKLYNWYINPKSLTRSGWTPVYMDSIESIEEQIAFFENSRYCKAYKKATAEYYKRAMYHVLYIKERSPKYDHLLDEARAKRDHAFKVCLKTAGPGAALYAWFVPSIMSRKKLRRIAKKVYAWLRYRQKQ